VKEPGGERATGEQARGKPEKEKKSQTPMVKGRIRRVENGGSSPLRGDSEGFAK